MTSRGLKKLKVSLMFSKTKTQHVGDMLKSQNGLIYFQLAPYFQKSNILISPFKIKSIPEPQTPLPTDASIFDGLFGVFSDSLPDAWGLLMMNRAMRRKGIDYQSSSALDRLAFIGNRGMGALIYEPMTETIDEQLKAIELSYMASEVSRILEGNAEEILSELLILGGSPGGARPKVMLGVSTTGKKAKRLVAGIDPLPKGYEHWLIKFHGKDERADAGIIEYIYAKTARHVGLNIQEYDLFKDSKGALWFGTKRFDRGPGESRIHCHSLAGLLHANYRLPSVDYESFLRTVSVLTKQNDDVLAGFRQAVFNVIFHNRDDHAKNFAFIMDYNGTWRLSPAFDLTYAIGPGGEHTSSIVGEGHNPKRQHLILLADQVGIALKTANLIIDQIEDGRSFMLDLFKQFEIKKHPMMQRL